MKKQREVFLHMTHEKIGENEMKKVILLGAGGFAREILETIDEINKHTEEIIMPIGFVYDGGDKERGILIHDIPVLGDLTRLKEMDLKEILLVTAVGTSVTRRKLVQEAKKVGGQFISIIHPTALVSRWATIGEGAVIQSYSVILPDVKIGNYFAGNGAVRVGHDTIIGDYVHINPTVNIAGGSIIGNDVFIGVKATILKAEIGDGAVIGACALITKDVPPNMLAIGIPAKFYKMEEKKY